MSSREPVWRVIPGFSMYEVSDQGQLRSWRNGKYGRAAAPRLMKLPLDYHGYPATNLRGDDGLRHTFRIHRLVLLAFRGPRPPGMDSRHANGDPTDNRLSNLNYSTRSRNMRDRVRHGTHHMAIKTHCPAGHPYDQANTVMKYKPDDGGPNRQCRECRREQSRLLRDAARAMRTVAKLVVAETRPTIEVERVRELIPPDLLARMGQST